MDFRLPLGNRAKVGKMTLRSNGRVDRAEGKPPAHGIKSMSDPRLEEFVKTRDFSVLGEGWKGYLDRVNWGESGTGRLVAGANAMPRTDDSVSAQFLILDPRARTLTLQTQGLQQEHFNHWIQVRIDGRQGIKADSVEEWVSR